MLKKLKYRLNMKACEFSSQMTAAWLSMVKSESGGFETYSLLEDRDVKRLRENKKIPDDLSELRGIIDIAAYLIALNNYLK